jgi:hypothetical protein
MYIYTLHKGDSDHDDDDDDNSSNITNMAADF